MMTAAGKRIVGASCALVMAFPLLAAAQELPPDQQLVIGSLPCPSGAFGREQGVRQLLWELAKRTSAEANLSSEPVDPASLALFEHPLVVWSCPGALSPLPRDAAANLKRFLSLGGMLWIDDPSAAPKGAFDSSVGQRLAEMFPDQPLKPVSFQHVLFKTFFMLDRVAGRKPSRSHVLGMELDGRLAVVYTSGDLLGAVSRDMAGGWSYPVESGSDEQRETAFRLGINIVYYALCLDYKDDGVHLPFILKRRRL